MTCLNDKSPVPWSVSFQIRPRRSSNMFMWGPNVFNLQSIDRVDNHQNYQIIFCRNLRAYQVTFNSISPPDQPIGGGMGMFGHDESSTTESAQPYTPK